MPRTRRCVTIASSKLGNRGHGFLWLWSNSSSWICLHMFSRMHHDYEIKQAHQFQVFVFPLELYRNADAC
jgi:hypothetical protein